MAKKFFSKVGKAFKKAAPVLKGIAPMALSALGASATGPFAPLVMGLAKGLLGAEDSTDDQLLARISEARPEDLIALKQLDAQVELKRLEYGIDEKQMYLVDIQSARQRHIAVRDKEPARLTYAALVVVVGGVVAVALYATELDPFAQNIIALVIGSFLTKADKGYNFFLGSSLGSKEKEQQIRDIIQSINGRDTEIEPE